MQPLALIALGIFGGAPTVLSGASPEPVALLLATPTGEAGRVSRSETIRAVAAALEAASELTPVLMDPTVNQDCRGRMACIIAALAATDAAPPEWLLVLTQVSLEGLPDRVSLTLVDAQSGIQLLAEPSPEDDEVRLDAVSTRAPSGTIEDVTALQTYLSAAFRRELRSPLARAGKLKNQGMLVLADTIPGALVHLDGRAIGTTGAGETRVIRIPPGPHELNLKLGESTWRAAVTVDQEAVYLRPQLQLPGGQSVVRPTFAVGGAALALTGAALIVVAAITADGNVKTACLAERTGCTGGSSFVGLDYDPMAALPNEIDPPGLGWVPVGASLATVGIGLAVGSLFEEGNEVPWWSVGASLLAGGAVLGASLALDRGTLP